jgi:hypothetical protein
MVHDELEKTLKESALAYFKLLNQHFSGGNEETPDRCSNPRAHEYKAGPLLLVCKL